MIVEEAKAGSAPEPKFRPWTWREAQKFVGCQLRPAEDPELVTLLLSVNSNGFNYSGGATGNRFFTNCKAFAKLEYSIDWGKTWQPCGVIE